MPLNRVQQFEFGRMAALHLWNECDVLSKLTRCSYVVDGYGYGLATAADGRTLQGYTCTGEGASCLLLEWIPQGSLWKQLVPEEGVSKPMSASQGKPVSLLQCPCCCPVGLKAGAVCRQRPSCLIIQWMILARGYACATVVNTAAHAASHDK